MTKPKTKPLSDEDLNWIREYQTRIQFHQNVEEQKVGNATRIALIEGFLLGRGHDLPACRALPLPELPPYPESPPPDETRAQRRAREIAERKVAERQRKDAVADELARKRAEKAVPVKKAKKAVKKVAKKAPAKKAAPKLASVDPAD